MKPLVKWVKWLATVAALLALLLPSVAQASRAQAAPAAEGAFAAGTVVALKGTPHLWFADDRGDLHWGGDTRALAGHPIDWNRKVELSLEQLRSLPIGDPWLSAGLLKDGDPIYLVKWEVSDRVPTLLHIQAIADVQLFGITSANYGRFVLDRAEWERRYGMSASSLPRGELASAQPAGARTPQPGDVLLADSLGDPAKGVLPVGATARTQLGYESGEYFLRKLDPNVDVFPLARVPGSFRNVSLAVDARLVGDTADRFVMLGCRENAAGDSFYAVVVWPAYRLFTMFRSDAGDYTELVPPLSASAIRGGNETNRIELSCAESTIAVRINGTEVASVQDSSYQVGDIWLGAGAHRQTADARFRNLVVTQR